MSGVVDPYGNTHYLPLMPTGGGAEVLQVAPTLIDPILDGATVEDNTAAFVATPNFPGVTTGAAVFLVGGSLTDPLTTNSPCFIIQNWQSDSGSTGYISLWKVGDNPTSALFTETYDTNGNQFFEGHRVHAYINAGAVGGSAYGAVFSAGTATALDAYTYLVGNEPEIINKFADAPAVFNPNSFAACVNLSSSGTKMIDAGITLNPFNTGASRARRGYYVPLDTVNNAAFESAATGADAFKSPNFLVTGAGVLTAVTATFNTGAQSAFQIAHSGNYTQLLFKAGQSITGGATADSQVYFDTPGGGYDFRIGGNERLFLSNTALYPPAGSVSLGLSASPFTTAFVSGLVTLTNQTDGAAAQAGTLTNAPVAGNPAIWITVSVNGATRRIPAW